MTISEYVKLETPDVLDMHYTTEARGAHYTRDDDTRALLMMREANREIREMYGD
jgi:hypothetical protein